MNGIFQRTMIWLTLLSLIFSGSEVGPALMAGLAECDGQHQVQVQQSSHSVAIVLHHVAGPTHHHGVAAQLALAGVSDDQSQDHVVTFSLLDQGTTKNSEALTGKSPCVPVLLEVVLKSTDQHDCLSRTNSPASLLDFVRQRWRHTVHLRPGATRLLI